MNVVDIFRKIEELAFEAIKPAKFRTLLDVYEESNGSTGNTYYQIKNQRTGKGLKGWNPVSFSDTEPDSYHESLGQVNTPVVERLVEVKMTHAEILNAQAGKTSSSVQKITSLYNVIENELEELTLKGGRGLTGLFETTNTTALGATFLNATGDNIIKKLADVIEMSKNNSVYTGKKRLLMGSDVLNIIRTKTVGTTGSVTVIEQLKKIFSEIESIDEAPHAGKKILVYEKNPSLVNCLFTFPLKEVGTEEKNGGFSSTSICRFAGLQVHAPKSIAALVGS